MKKTMFLFILILILALIFMGCSSKSMKEPSELSITIDNLEIEYVAAKNKWNGDVYDREDTFVTILKEDKEIPTFGYGSIVEIVFKSNPPNKFTVYDILIDESGKQIYMDKEIKNIPVELNNGKCSFNINKHIASYLSSYYEPDKKDIRGFRMIASWGENECEYAFVIKTYSENEHVPNNNTVKNTDTNTEHITDKANQKVPEIIEVNLPIAVRDDGNFKGAFTAAGDYFYYEGDNGVIYRVPIDNPNNKTIVYELPLWTYGDSYVYPKLETINNTVFLLYHQGGAVMGSDYKIILYEDGTNEEYSAGYYNKKIFDDNEIFVSHYVPPSKGGLAIKKLGDKEYKDIGLWDYYYGWVVVGSGFGRSDDLYLIDDYIYILATYDTDEKKGTTGIHKVNIKTGETTRLCEESAKKFIIADDYIYFVDLKGFLYKLQMEQSTAEKLLDKSVNDFVVLNHQVYYVTQDNFELFKLEENESLNPEGIVKSLKIEDGYVIGTFDDKSSSSVKLMIFNGVGNIVFKSESSISHISVNSDRIFYVK